MKRFTLFIAALALGLSMLAGNAEAARLGGGKSFGMQRQMSPAMSRPATAAPAASAVPRPAAAPAPAQAGRSWLGPIAGLAAGLGLAALASHFGFGEGLANIMMIVVLAFAAMAIIGFIMRRRVSPVSAPQMAGNAPTYGSFGDNASTMNYQAEPAASGTAANGGNIPADFDTEAFIRSAKVGFIRLQAANDAGDLADIREFTSPEMFAEIRMDLEQRNGAPQKTDVISLNAEILDVGQEGHRYVVSVRFSGLLRETADAAPTPIDEIWHLVKPITGQGGWVLGGIQQVQ